MPMLEQMKIFGKNTAQHCSAFYHFTPRCGLPAFPSCADRLGNRRSWLFVLLVVSIIFPPAYSARALEVYVSPNGSDSNAGTVAAPYATLEKARDAVRSAKAAAKGPSTVWLAGGTYLRSKGFALEAADSDSSYRAVRGASPTLSLCRPVPATLLQPVTAPEVLARIDPAARTALRQFDLKALGANPATRFRDNFRGNGGLFDLFQRGVRLPISRWPNGGTNYEKIQEVLFGGASGGSSPAGGRFIFTGDRPSRWAGALPGGVWLAGFWRVPWICEAVRVGEIDPAAHTITLAVPVGGGIGSKYSKTTLPDGTRRGDGMEKWFALNLLEEIDQPGEWCIDFASQIVYVWPASDPAKSPLMLADVREPLISIKDATQVQIAGLTLDGGADDGIRIERGADVLVAGCKIRNFARRGVVVADGLRHRILSNDISQTGLNAIALRGGDRLTLKPCGHRVTNNEIDHAGEYEPTAAVILGMGESLIGNGMGVNCVGAVFSHNRIHHVPNAGVYYSGNDNVIELNEVFRIGLNSGDLGGFYSSGGWTSRGNTVRNNFVHHSPAANAFYVDDGDSGDLIAGNVAYKVLSGSLVGGGHDNTLKGNIFMDCEKAGIRVDARGLSRNYTMTDRRLGDDFRSVRPDQEPWSKRFPEMQRLLTTDPRIPSGIVIEENVFVACGITIPKKPEESAGITVGNNFLTKENPGFVDIAQLNFSLKPDSEVFKALPGFTPIPFDKIGLFTDEFRPRLPAGSMEPAADPAQPAKAFDSAVDIDASNRKPK